MSQVKIQEFIIGEIEVNHLGRLKKGQTFAARDEMSKQNWTAKLVARGYSASEAAVIFNDARDMALLNLRAA